MSHRPLRMTRRPTPEGPAVLGALAAGGALEAPVGGLTGTLAIEKDPDLNWHQFAILLLETAAEIEHALLVQYLYAAYSLRPGVPIPNQPAGTTTTSINPPGWQIQIVRIAKEEMGHLLSVQNLLRSLGGPLDFERERLPFRSQFYPFPFMLEPFTKNALAKYVAAEMPEDVSPYILPPEEKQAIWDRATLGTHGVRVNQVGVLYETLIKVFTEYLRDEDLPPGAVAWQAREALWQGNENDDDKGIKVLPITLDPQMPTLTLRDRAIRALKIIARQGEGITPGNMAMAAADALDNSHFMRFLAIYRQFPDDGSSTGFEPTRPVPVNPNTTPPPLFPPMDLEGILLEQKLQPGRITHPTTLPWAYLFNVRYHVLLAELAHALQLRTDGDEGAVRLKLMTWVVQEMRQRPASSLRDLAGKLGSLPQSNLPGYVAGAPFELPNTTLSIPDRGPDRWRLHLDLLDAAESLMDQIDPGKTDPLINSLRTFEEENDGSGTGATGRRQYIVAHLNSPY